MTGTTGSTHLADPRADCVADAAGGVTFDIAGHDSGGAAEPVLVLSRRGAAPADEVRLPLTPAGEGRVRAVLPSTVELAEGHWDVSVAGRPVRPGVRDVRALVDRRPDRSRPVGARVPYPAADGHLAVRAWLRPRHAEAGDLTFGGGGCTVEGLLYGAELGEGAVAEARWGREVRQAPVEGGEDGAFAFTLPYGPLAEPRPDGQRLWQLWLRPAAGAEPVRVARLLDDVWDRRNVFVYPESEGDGFRAAPCYSADNELCVRVVPVA
ncbi:MULTISPECIES: hypothetical protein [Streptomyces]|uniref:Transferase n=1 Tax=Streptomyces fradiae ATCC 10745 = DSM 40063 TaxID=1319510 RepID=A0A1Y2P2Y3_STRFR|nr:MULTISPECIES: hypothetical protein [Streptomyces]KAF0646541.1 hypothetical protein K701_28180 [Streptomyces fradiae ATCC 10745 = DSM 40063]KAF0650356.1 hypothetical protein K701_07250 [Streptomyces fradiae ATCC 10745 = DSM 40063]OSY54124.1 hypothetical protein BG846_00196 [Streptomyces fradiae ATCC 10745 = DSM 40063]QEV11492.1 hypothetical protein CP974_05070 [Streptomyces fradiae ATCC 10745 = DSM 40063]